MRLMIRKIGTRGFILGQRGTWGFFPRQMENETKLWEKKGTWKLILNRRIMWSFVLRKRLREVSSSNTYVRLNYEMKGQVNDQKNRDARFDSETFRYVRFLSETKEYVRFHAATKVYVKFYPEIQKYVDCKRFINVCFSVSNSCEDFRHSAS